MACVVNTYPPPTATVIRTSPPVYTSTDATATASLQMTGRTGVDSANDTYSSTLITRWNAGRVHRLTNVSDHTVYFKAVVTPGTQALNAQNLISVYVNGVYSQSLTVTDGPVTGQPYYVSQLGSGTKTVELWEPFQATDGTTLDNGSDRHFYSAYVTSVVVPSGATMAKATATKVNIIVGESISDGGVANTPWISNGWGGQLRLAAHTAGQLVGFYAYSTLLGDGRTATQRGDDIVALAQAMGASTLNLIVQPRPNDYAYGSGVGSVQTTTAQFLTGYGAMLDQVRASFPTCTVDFNYKLSQGSSVSGTNGVAGGGDIAAYWTALAGITTGRSWVTLHDQSALLTLATDYSEAANSQVHPNQTGHNKMFAAIRAYANINL